MADAPQGPISIRSRIAALNLEEIHAPAPGTKPAFSYEQSTANKKKPPPPPPPAQRPTVQPRQQTVNNPPILSHDHANSSPHTVGNQPIESRPSPPNVPPSLPPRLPPRSNTSASLSAPSLPPRKGSDSSLQRKDSDESISTTASGFSAVSIGSTRTSVSGAADRGPSFYKVRAPAYDPASLPPLPPKKTPEEPKQSATLKAIRSPSNTVSNRILPPQLPSRPPLPSRQSSRSPATSEEEAQPSQPPQPPRRLPPLPKRSALEFGLNKATETPPPIPSNRPSDKSVADTSGPPPVPLSSRPNLDAIMRSKPRPGAVGFCLKCRDFSRADEHAARFPRGNLPSSDVGWLAHQLTSPFPSATDKARVIFTWLHHNIDYDTHSFFGGNICGSTPERTVTTGLAVCEGYAGLFSALALKAGLESVVISGDGKGYGHVPLKPGEPIPAFKSNHAWNAVRIDHGEWKLIDCCWGAGNVQGPHVPYERNFKAYWFTMDNNEFGLTHYPSDRSHFYRLDGRTLSWEEYMTEDVGERLTVYSAATPDHGIGERTFQPAMKQIKVYDPQEGPMIRFQFSAVCPHWDNEKHGKGKPYQMVLHVGGRDGRKTDWVAFQTDGKSWWLDMNRVELGCPGQKVSVYAVTSINNKDARGVGYAEYQAKKGKSAMGFGGVAMWELV